MDKLRLPFVLLLSLTLAACGFQLRGSASLPPQMQAIYLDAGINQRLLLREFEYLLNRQGGSLVASRAEASVVLQLQQYTQYERVVAMDNTGYTREKELTAVLQFQVLDPQLQVILSPRKLDQQTTVLVDKDNVLASQRSQSEAYQQLQRRLAMVLLNALRFELNGNQGSEANEAGH